MVYVPSICRMMKQQLMFYGTVLQPKMSGYIILFPFINGLIPLRLPMTLGYALPSSLTGYEDRTEMGFDKVDFEDNAQTVVNVINSLKTCLAWYGELVEDAKIFLVQNLLWSVFYSQRRKPNGLVMAKLGIDSIQTKKLWLSKFPCKIFQAIAGDMVH